jgi:sugar/nucleoside kinase (ribokinase family)
MKPAVALIGHVCIDHNHSEHVSYVSWGSAVLHMAHYLRNHVGVDPAIIARHGEDFGEHTEGLQLYPRRPESGATLVYENTVRAAQRWQHCRSSRAATPVPLDMTVKRLVKEADIIVVAPLLPNMSLAYVRELLAQRKAGSLAVLSPQGYFRSVGQDGAVRPRTFTEARELLPLFDLAVFSEDDCLDTTEITLAWPGYGPTQLVMTQSEQGASIVSHGGLLPIPTTTVPDRRIVDSVGCGDVFTAAVAYAYAMDRDLVAAVKAGHAAAGAKLLASNASTV